MCKPLLLEAALLHISFHLKQLATELRRAPASPVTYWSEGQTAEQTKGPGCAPKGRSLDGWSGNDGFVVRRYGR